MPTIKAIIVDMPDGEWAVPLDVIARDRATVYAPEFGGDVQRSLDEDTLVLFGEPDGAGESEAIDWADNEMNWSDVEPHAFRLPGEVPAIDRQEAWLDGEKWIADVETADTEIHDTPPVVLSGLVKGGEIATVAEYEMSPTLPRHFVLLVDASGRVVADRAGVGRALRTGAFPLTWYRYEEA